MHSSPVAKDRQLHIRFGPEDEARLALIARHHEATVAQVVRMLIKQEADRIRSDGSFHVSAWNGSNTTCLFWVGHDLASAKAEAKRLAHQFAGQGLWTVFRVFDHAEKTGPVHEEVVKVAKAR